MPFLVASLGNCLKTLNNENNMLLGHRNWPLWGHSTRLLWPVNYYYFISATIVFKLLVSLIPDKKKEIISITPMYVISFFFFNLFNDVDSI